MKILILYTNFSTIGGDQPVGIASIMGMLKKYGYQYTLFDTSFIMEDPLNENDFAGHKIKQVNTINRKTLQQTLVLFKQIRLSDFEFLFVSSLSPSFNTSINFVDIYKKENPQGFVVVGGIHATVAPDEVIQLKGVDAVCIGEGEKAIIDLLKHFGNTNIKNFWFKQADKVIKNDIRTYINMDTLPYPDYSLFEENHFYRPLGDKIYRSLAIELSRGCPFSCNYCINKYLQNMYNGISRHHRQQSVKYTISKLLYLKNTYNIEFFRFIDESFSIMSIKKMKIFAEEYTNKIKIPFWVQTSANTLNEEKVQLLKKMNCMAVTIGVEHGNEKFRKEVLNKNVSDKSIFEAMSLLKKYDIRRSAYFMIGLPFETRDLFFDTVNMYKMLIYEYGASPSSIQCFYPFKGTYFYELCKKHNFITDKSSEYYAIARPALDMPNFSYEEILGLKRTFFAYSICNEKMYPIIATCEKGNDKLLKYIEKTKGNFFPSEDIISINQNQKTIG